MKLLNYTFVFILLLFLANCTKVVDVSLETGGEQLVINGFISPQDDTIKIRISKSLPLGEKREFLQALPNAEVIISSENEKASLIYDKLQNRYLLSTAIFPILAEKKYTLDVKTDNSLSAKASCYIPKQMDDFSVLIDSSRMNGAARDYYVKYQWQDFPNEANYYRVIGVTEVLNFSVQLNDTVKKNRPFIWADYENEEAFVSDEFLDGQILTSPVSNLQQFGEYGGQVRYISNTKLICFLLHTDKNYFLFHRSIIAAQNTLTANDLVVLHSNVEGGLGIFAAYNIKEKIIQLN